MRSFKGIQKESEASCLSLSQRHNKESQLHSGVCNRRFKKKNKIKEVSECYCPEYELRSVISTFPSESVCVPDCL